MPSSVRLLQSTRVVTEVSGSVKPIFERTFSSLMLNVKVLSKLTALAVAISADIPVKLLSALSVMVARLRLAPETSNPVALLVSIPLKAPSVPLYSKSPAPVPANK